jgi:transcriptional regulator with XRE-family HTH domain
MLIRQLKKGPAARAKFVDSEINKTTAFQIRSLRGDASQQQVMEKLGMNQNAISRLENPYYGKATLTTLKRIAAAHDVGLLVEFVPFSRLIDRASGTPFLDPGLSPSTMNVQGFSAELPRLEIEAARVDTPITALQAGSMVPRQPLSTSGTGELLDVTAPSVSGALTVMPESDVAALDTPLHRTKTWWYAEPQHRSPMPNITPPRRKSRRPERRKNGYRQRRYA